MQLSINPKIVSVLLFFPLLAAAAEPRKATFSPDNLEVKWSLTKGVEP
jgi:hypothetical protein